MELCKLTITELSKMLREKKISASELTADVYTQIEKVENDVKSYITLQKDEAMKKAAKIDEKFAANEDMPLLAGIPAGIKDNICTQGIKTTCASKILENFVPPYSATVMNRFEEQGVITVGKLNMDEFAMGSSCENSAFFKTKNPHDLERDPGGSSGGSAASVAAFENIFSLGSDTGGSIRQPASYCGVAGLKPTYGAVSRYGLVAFASSLDQIGPLTRSIEDMAIVANTLYGHDSYDSTSLNYKFEDFTKDLDGNVKGVKIGLPKEYFSEGIDKDVKEQILNAAKTYEKMGAELVEISLSLSDFALPTYYILSSAEASSNLARFDGVKYGYRTENFTNLNELYVKTRSEGFGDEVKRRILLGTYVLSSGYYDAYYKKALQARKMIKNNFEEAFKKVDVILTPATPETAFKMGEKTDDPLKMYMSDICTVAINIAGIPALVTPCGKDSKGLPIGMQLIGKERQDGFLMKVADAYDKNTGMLKAMAAKL